MAVTIKYKSEKKPIQVYRFGPETDGDASLKEVLGGKGANLAEMAKLGIPVPPGFTIPCELSIKYQKVRKFPTSLAAFNRSLWNAVDGGLKYLSSTAGGELPLLSVRSGARVSMPGMMDTILNIGLNHDSVGVWGERLGWRTALDSYRRLLQMYGSVALEIPMAGFDEALEKVKSDANVSSDADLTAKHLEKLVNAYMEVYEQADAVFPQTVEAQLRGAIRAVFNSWNTERAVHYRKIHNIPNEWGTAVNVQSMVFGNAGDDSCTGVLFSRNPSTGVKTITGEWLVNAQGEDVVAGIRTPNPLSQFWEWNPKAASELVDIISKLEIHYRDMQDIEFTVQNGYLYILQTRNGKRAPKAAFTIARDLVVDGLISKEEAVSRVSQSQLLAALKPALAPGFDVAPELVGIAGGGGLVAGHAVFDSESAINCNGPCILIRKETSPDDIVGMNAAVGILTSTGGLTSHAAVVARGMNKSCVVGAIDLKVYPASAVYEDKFISPGDWVTIDGATGNVWVKTKVLVISGEMTFEIKDILSWAAGPDTHEKIDLTSDETLDSLIAKFSDSTAPGVVITTALLDYNSQEATRVVRDCGKALKGFGGAVTVSISGVEDEIDPLDNLLIGNSEGARSNVTMALIEWPIDVIEKTFVTGGTKNHTELLDEAGFIVPVDVSTVADLINAKGPINTSEEVVEKVFGGSEAYKQVLKWAEQSFGSKPPMASVDAKYWYEIL